MPSAKIILYKSKVLKDGSHPIMLQVINDRQIKRLALRKSCKPTEWTETSSRFNKNYNDYKKDNASLDKLSGKIAETMYWFESQDIPFTIQKFLEKLGRKGKSKNVYECFEEIILRLQNEENYSNMKVYKDTQNSLKRFVGQRLIFLPDIDYGLLKRYESYLRSSGCEDSGIHLRMRTLRAVYNEAIKLGYTPEELYPFSTHNKKKGYSLSHLKLEYKPRSLSAEEIESLKSWDSSKIPQLRMSHLMFLFSYYSNGINFTDLAGLQWSNIHNEKRLIYKRQKTNRYQDIPLSDNIRNILSEIPRSDSIYIFPVLDSTRHITSLTIYNRVKKCLKQFNKDLKEIQEILSIETPLTSYTARHSYAMALRRNGTNQDVISHLLGHADVKTTDHYLSQLDNSYYDSANECL